MDKIELTVLVNKVNTAKVKEVGSTPRRHPSRPHDGTRSRSRRSLQCR
jgi:hypothetical protein